MTIQVMNMDMGQLKLDIDIVTKNTCISPFIEGVKMFCENMTEKLGSKVFFYI